MTEGKYEIPYENQNPLHHAAKNGDSTTVRSLLQQNVPVNFVDEDLRTPLWLASAYGHSEIVTVLSDHGANVNTPDRSGITPLQAALLKRSTGVISVLLCGGAQIGIDTGGGISLLKAVLAGSCELATKLLDKGADLEAQGEGKNIALALASFHGHNHLVSVLLTHGADIESQNDEKSTPLLIASAAGHVKVVHTLLERKAKVNTRSSSGNTPLQLASALGHEMIVSILLDHGANVDSFNISGHTSLQVAAAWGHERIASILLDHGAKVDSLNTHGDTPLLLAASRGHEKIASMLLDHGAKVDSLNTHGYTPLLLAASQGHEKIASMLLDHGAKVDSLNTYGDTPLLLATSQGHEKIASMLLDHGAKVDSLNPHDETPLLVAVSQGYEKITSMLLDHGAKVDSLNNHGDTPLLLAASQGHEKIASILLDHGAKVDSLNPHNDTPLLVAASQGHERIASILLDHGAKVNSLNTHGDSPLLVAASQGYERIASMLLDHGANVDSFNISGNTSLQMAAARGHDQAIFTLLSRGASIDACNKTGNTALQLACANGHDRIVPILLSHGATVDACNYQGGTSLHLTAEKGNPMSIRHLLSHQKPDARVDALGQTPLHLACFSGKKDNAEVLLNQGANINAENYQRFTPLHCAVSLINAKADQEINSAGGLSGRDDLIQLLLDRGADLHRTNQWGNSPLFVACNAKNRGAIKRLIQYGANVHQRGYNEKTPFQISVEADSTDHYVDLIFEKPGVLRTDEQGNSALHEASLRGNLRKVQSLLNQEKPTYLIRGSQGKGPLSLAISHNHYEVALCILKSELYYPESCVERHAHPTSQYDSQYVEAYLEDLATRSKLSLDDFNSIVYWMVANKSMSFFRKRCLRDLAAVQYKGRMSLLHIAAQYNNTKLIWDLWSDQSHDLTVTTQDQDQNTALHASASSGNLEASKILLETWSLQADGSLSASLVLDFIMQRNKMEDSPFSLAVKKGHARVRDYFRGMLVKHAKSKEALKSDSTRMNAALELAFRFEKPQTQERLIELMETWFDKPSTQTHHWKILHYVAYHEQVIALWWLLSNGWVFDRTETNMAIEILKSGTSENRKIMMGLLQNPPQVIEQSGITDSGYLPDVPPSRLSSLIKSEATVIAFYAKDDFIELHSIQKSLDDIIYNPNLGLQKVIELAYSNHHNQLDSLRQIIQKSNEIRVDAGYFSTLGSQDTGLAAQSGPRTLNFQWFHLPFNHMGIIDDLCQRLSIESKRTRKLHHAMATFFRRSSVYVPAGAGKCFLKPSFMERSTEQHDAPTSTAQFSINETLSIHMPYLTKAIVESSQKGKEKGSFTEELADLHEPMTLDQFFYPSLEIGHRRDNDQVVTRWTKGINCDKTNQSKGTVSEQQQPDPQQILTVDQIWIRVLDEKTIVSSCTNPMDATGARLSERVRRFIGSEKEKDDFARPKTTKAVIEIILSILTGLFLEEKFDRTAPEGKDNAQSMNGLEVFQDSVRRLMEKETELYEHFLEKLERESNSNVQKGPFKDPSKNPYHVIYDESHMLREIEDIRDELNILTTLFEGQEQVWKATFKTDDLDTFSGFQYSHTTNPTRILRDLKRIEKEAINVQDSINALLNLRLQHAGIKDVEFGRQQAKISLVFTIVATLFLPLSFLTSLFALNVSDFPHSNGDVQFQGKWIFPIIFCTSACVSLPLLFFAFNISQAVDIWDALKLIGTRSRYQSRSNSAVSQKNMQFPTAEEADGSPNSFDLSRSLIRQMRQRARQLGVINQSDQRTDSEMALDRSGLEG